MSKNKQKKRGRSFTEYLSVKAELPSDALAGEVRIELRGRNSLFLGGCRRIVKYTQELIVLRVKDGDVGVFGEHLICTSYHAGNVSVEGRIKKVSFSEEEE